MSAIPSLQGVRARVNTALSRLALGGLDQAAVSNARIDLTGALADLTKLIEAQPMQTRRRLEDHIVLGGASA